MEDPTKSEMRETVDHLSTEEGFEDDFEIACYWFANFYHGGQASNLYSILSTSPYSPGQMESGPDENSFVYLLFEELVAEYSM